MQNPPFTPSGVLQKQTELYALPDQQLSIIANAIQSDPAAWGNNNFNLTSEQASYLQQMPQPILGYLGDQAAIAIRNRLLVELIVNNPDDEAEDPTKRFDVKPANHASYQAGQGVTIQGKLTLEINFE